MERMAPPRQSTLRGPVAIFVIVLVLTLTLGVLWNVFLVHDYTRIRELAQAAEEEGGGAFHWTFIAVGSALFLTILILVPILGARLFYEIRWSRVLSNFLASVSHELNSPLQSIKLQVQTLTRPGVSDGDRKRFLEFIEEDVERLGVLIGNVLRAAQIDQNQLVPAPEQLMLRDFLGTFVERTTSTFERQGGKSEIRLLPGPEVCLSADRVLLRQALENLVSNAVKYSPDESARIEIAVRLATDGALVLGVTDRGIGIPRQELENVFERFYRIEDEDPARSRKGTGLGLSIVRSIAEAHEWQVSLTSGGKGTGTTVEFRIPRFEAVEPADSWPSEGAPT